MRKVTPICHGVIDCANQEYWFSTPPKKIALHFGISFACVTALLFIWIAGSMVVKKFKAKK